MTTRQLTSQGQERKQQLLDASARLFAEQGYASTRVADIVQEAGVAKGLFYWYFENKQALFRELAVDIRHQLRATQQAATDPDAPALLRILQGTIASVRYMADHAAFFSLLEVEGRSVVGEELRAGAEQHLRDVEVVIREGQADGTVTPDERPDLMALATVGAVSQFSHCHRTGRVDLELDELARYVAGLVARILAADEATARRSIAESCRLNVTRDQASR